MGEAREAAERGLMRAEDILVRAALSLRHEAVEDETALQAMWGMSQEEAALKVQLMFRGRRARNKMRKQLVGAWSKHRDAASGYYYYENKTTGDTQWETPVMFLKLFPGCSW